MNIEQRTVGDVMILSVMGDITMNTNGATRVSDKVRSALQQGRCRLVLDLGHVRYVDELRARGPGPVRTRPRGPAAAPSG